MSLARSQPELLSVSSSAPLASPKGRADFDAEFLQEMAKFLQKCQQGLERIVQIVQEDKRDLNIILDLTSRASNVRESGTYFRI